MAAPTLHGTPIATHSASAANISISIPTPANGEWVYVLYAVGINATLTPPSGYTLVANTLKTSGTVLTAGVYAHQWTTGDPTTGLVFATSANAVQTCIAATISGAAATTPTDDSNSQANTSSATNTSPSLTAIPSGHNTDLLLMFYAVTGGTRSFSAPTLGTIAVQHAGGPGACLATAALTSNAATGAQSVTDNAATVSVGIQIAVAPVVVAGGMIYPNRMDGLATGQAI